VASRKRSGKPSSLVGKSKGARKNVV